MHEQNACSGWVGLPYLNRFLTQNPDGSCGYGVNPIDIGCVAYCVHSGICSTPCNLDLPAGTTNYMEAGVYIDGASGGASNAMTLEAGATLEATGGWRSPIGVGTGSSLIVKGTAASPSVITSGTASPAPGDWGGICSSGGVIQATYLNVSYGGALAGCGGDTSTQYDVFDDNSGAPGSVSITHSNITNSVGEGIGLWNVTPTLTHDSFTNNAVPIRFDHLYDATNLMSFSGLSAGNNTDNAILIVGAAGCCGNTISGTGTWPNTGIPTYHVLNGIIVSQGGSLTLGAGTTVKMQTCWNCGIDVQGSFTANGTAAKPVTFTSDAATPSPGNWPGFHLQGGTTGSTVNLRFAKILYAGSTYSQLGAISTDGSIPAVITNSTIAYSQGNDVEASGGSLVLHYDSFLAPGSGYYGVINDAGGSCNTAGVDATHDFWGSNSGPASSCNTGGTGSAVSNGVAFGAFLSLGISPSSGVPGSTATVSGKGFAAGESVTIKWNCPAINCSKGTTLAVATAGSNGSFHTTVTVPATASAGRYTIGGIGSTSFAFVTASFTVRPALSITPSSGAHGSSAAVSGSGYHANQTVTIRWNCSSSTCGSTTILGTVTTNAGGDFNNLGVTIPSATVGTYSLGGKDTGGAFGSTTYQVTS